MNNVRLVEEAGLVHAQRVQYEACSVRLVQTVALCRAAFYLSHVTVSCS